LLQTNDRYWIDLLMGLLAKRETRHKAEAVLEELRRRDYFEQVELDPTSRVQVAATMKELMGDSGLSNSCRCYAVKLYAKYADVDPIEAFDQAIYADWLTDFSEAFVGIAIMEALAPRAQAGDEDAIYFIRRIWMHNRDYRIIDEAGAKALGEPAPEYDD